MGYKTVWIDEGECKTCLKYPSYFGSIGDQNIVRYNNKENTGFCMIYWTDCTCSKCGRKWEEQ